MNKKLNYFQQWHEVVKIASFVSIAVFGLSANVLAFCVLISDPKVFKRASCVFTLNLIGMNDVFNHYAFPNLEHK